MRRYSKPATDSWSDATVYSSGLSATPPPPNLRVSDRDRARGLGLPSLQLSLPWKLPSLPSRPSPLPSLLLPPHAHEETSLSAHAPAAVTSRMQCTSHIGRICSVSVFSSMMLHADCSSEMQQNPVLSTPRMSIQISSPQTGSMLTRTKLPRRLTTMTVMPYPSASADAVSVQKTAKERLWRGTTAAVSDQEAKVREREAVGQAAGV